MPPQGGGMEFTMKQGIFRIRENIQIAPDMYEMALEGDISAVTNPGQFVNIALDGFYLRRPLSVHDVDPALGVLRVIYKAVGRGTEVLAKERYQNCKELLEALQRGQASI